MYEHSAPTREVGEEYRRLLNTKIIQIITERTRLNWFGHVRRHEEEEILKKYLYFDILCVNTLVPPIIYHHFNQNIVLVHHYMIGVIHYRFLHALSSVSDI